MLQEIYKYFTTPCAPHLKSMGYLKELIALEARYKRCQVAWGPHIQKTKSVIIEAATHVEQNNKAVVLGSGILCDIPIDVLSKRFETVHLVDICFLKSTQNFLRRYPNVTFQAADMTGLARPLYEWARHPTPDEAMPVPECPEDIQIDNADLVISANVISQLPLTPLQYLRKEVPTLSEPKLAKLAHNIIKAHRAFLINCPGTVCLISEIERRYIDGDRTIETEDPLWGHSIKPDGDEWSWTVAPRSELSDAYELRNRVVGSVWHRHEKL